MGESVPAPSCARRADRAAGSKARAAATIASSRALPVTRRLLGEVPPCLQMLACELVKQQRAVRPREAAVGRIGRRRLHLVGLVQVVEPVAVNEAVLQRDCGNAPTAGLEHQRASPSAGLGIGDDHLRTQCLKGGSSLVHRARRPGKLQIGYAAQLLFDQRPQVVTAYDGGGADIGLDVSNAKMESRAFQSARDGSRTRQPANAVDWRGHQIVWQGIGELAQPIAPSAHAEVGARAKADHAHVTRQARVERADHRADVRLVAGYRPQRPSGRRRPRAPGRCRAPMRAATGRPSRWPCERPPLRASCRRADRAAGRRGRRIGWRGGRQPPRDMPHDGIGPIDEPACARSAAHTCSRAGNGTVRARDHARPVQVDFREPPE